MGEKNHEGRTFGYIKIINNSFIMKNGKRQYLCECVCGKNFYVTLAALVSGNTRSCGCKRKYLMEQKCLEKYGHKDYRWSEEGKKRVEKILIDKFGVDNPSKNKNVRDKTKKTNLERYGFECPLQNKTVLEKGKKTVLEKYGVSSVTLIPEIKEKISKSNMERFGAEHYFGSVEGKEKIKKIMLEKYGVQNPMQNLDISLRASKSSRSGHIALHWKTKKEVICTASYEKKVVDWLNEEEIDYLWQPVIFKLPDGSTYRPDMYLVFSGTWIEIKGFFREKSKIKWDWFHKECPSSEIWDREYLKSIGIKIR